MEVRPLRRAHPPLQETHGSQALQVPPLRPLLLPVRPLGTPHEKAPVRTASPLFTSYDLRGAPWITTDKKSTHVVLDIIIEQLQHGGFTSTDMKGRNK
ncbi:hypothetical protein Pcinc_035519 [Petrolisthes cinctipes]|uniref:Uncharacterized protein n=1 Tax=Petrolisthes cinctipes TaxID=88211 RepID=A0AAE1BWF6_PETCI|nr:hypothetical protein Pcinc_035519 [Petrolisthes cinctipes]